MVLDDPGFGLPRLGDQLGGARWSAFGQTIRRGAQARNQSRHHGQGLVVEGGDDVLVEAGAPLDLPGGKQGRLLVLRPLSLGLDTERDAQGFGEIEQIVEPGDAFGGKPGTEPGSGVEPFDLGPIHCRDRPGPGRGSVEQVIVHHHRHAILGKPQIRLEHRGSQFHGQPEGSQCLLWSSDRVAAMGNDAPKHDESLVSHMMTYVGARQFAITSPVLGPRSH